MLLANKNYRLILFLMMLLSYNSSQRRFFGKSSKGAMLLANKNYHLILFLMMLCFLKIFRKCAFSAKAQKAQCFWLIKTIVNSILDDVVFLKNISQRRFFGKSSKGAMLLANENYRLILFLMMLFS